MRNWNSGSTDVLCKVTLAVHSVKGTDVGARHSKNSVTRFAFMALCMITAIVQHHPMPRECVYPHPYFRSWSAPFHITILATQLPVLLPKRRVCPRSIVTHRQVLELLPWAGVMVLKWATEGAVALLFSPLADRLVVTPALSLVAQAKLKALSSPGKR